MKAHNTKPNVDRSCVALVSGSEVIPSQKDYNGYQKCWEMYLRLQIWLLLVSIPIGGVTIDTLLAVDWKGAEQLLWIW